MLIICGLIKRIKMQIEISKQEAWKLLDAIKTYSKDYALNGAVQKTFENLVKKLNKVVND
jgi:hypothetical protein